MQWSGTLLGFLASHCHCIFYHKIDMTATSSQVMPGCQSHIHQMFRSKKCIKNDHNRFSGFRDLDGFWKKNISQWLGCSWLIMTGIHHPLREFEGLGCSRRMSKTICWLSWTSARMGWNGRKQQSRRGTWIWRRHKNDGDGEHEHVEEGLVGPTYWWSNCHYNMSIRL